MKPEAAFVAYLAGYRDASVSAMLKTASTESDLAGQAAYALGLHDRRQNLVPRDLPDLLAAVRRMLGSLLAEDEPRHAFGPCVLVTWAVGSKRCGARVSDAEAAATLVGMLAQTPADLFATIPLDAFEATVAGTSPEDAMRAACAVRDVLGGAPPAVLEDIARAIYRAANARPPFPEPIAPLSITAD